MGKKIFVSYKYADDQVKNLDSQDNSTVRDYIDKFEEEIDSSDDIYKGETDGEDLSELDDDTIWEKLKDRAILGVRPRQSKLTKALPRYKSGIRIPTRVVLEKYAAALGKHIELRINDEE